MVDRKIFDFFCSCDLDLDPMTFIYNCEYIPWRYTGCANINFLRQGFQKLSSDRQTQVRYYNMLLRRWSSTSSTVLN